MPINVNQWSALGIQYAFWGTKINNSFNGTTTTALTNGSSSGMGTLQGVTGVQIEEPNAEPIVILGNNGAIGQFLAQPQSLPGGSMTFSVFDQTFYASANGLKVYAEGDYDEVGGFPACFSFSDLCFVFNSPAKSTETGNLGSGWSVLEVWLANAQVKASNNMATNALQEFNGQLIMNLSDTDMEGKTVTSTNWGGTKFAFNKYFSPYPVTYHKLVGNGSTTTVTLNETPVAANGTAVRVVQGGTALAYTTNYTVNTSTKVVTFVTAPTASSSNLIRYQFVPTC